MLYHNLLIAFRNLLKNKTYSSINLIGLSVGLGCCFLILLFVQHELSFDNFHEKKDRIYRVKYTNSGTHLAASPPPVAPALKSELSGITETARMYSRSASIELRDEEEGVQKFNEEDFFFTDLEIFDILDFNVVRGSLADLREPFTIAINEDIAGKYYGDEDPINKQLFLDGQHLFTVKSVVQDFPANSHIRFNFLSEYETMFRVEGETARKGIEENWVVSHSYTYVLLDEGRDAEEINAQIGAMIDRHIPPGYRSVIDFSLQPLSEIHLEQNVELNSQPTGNLTYIYMFGAIGIIILLIACINFINLAIANSLKRIKEVGVRKVMGGSKAQMIVRFMTESSLICVAAFFISIYLIRVGIPYMNSFTGRNIGLDEMFNVSFLGLIILVFALSAFIAGSYPAFFASRFEPASVLKGNTGTGTAKTGMLNKTLVIFQFTASVILISGSMIIYKQLHYMQNMNLGFDKELVLTVPVFNQNINNVFKGISPDVRSKMNAFEESLMTNPKIKASTLSYEIPGRGVVSNVAIPEGYSAEDNMFMAFNAVDYDFIETYGLKVVAGRGFSKDAGTDHIDAMMINESAAKEFGWDPEEAVGKKFQLFKSGIIIGVVEDFHFSSLRVNIEPLGLGVIPSMFNYFSIKVDAAQLPATIGFVQERWEQFFPEKAFEYSFVDQELEQIYRSEQNLGKLINTFSFIAVFISCLGLFGLVAFTTGSRSKEIGIRKVLGASAFSISTMISAGFLKFIILSNLLALPLSYFLMQEWLEQFAHRIDLLENVWVFLTAGFLAIIIAAITINFKAISAASTNPVEVLSNE